MKPNNILISKFSLSLFILICFLFVPQCTFADNIDFNEYLTFSDIESQKIIELFPKQLFSKWVSSKSFGYSDPMETTTWSLLKEIIRLNVTNYLLKDLPIDISFKILDQSIELAKIIGANDVSSLLTKFEKETVKAAVSRAKEYLFKNQIKVSFGAMEVKYKTGITNVNSLFQYVITYKPIDDRKGRLIAKLYSTDAIDPPSSRGSVGMSIGFLNELSPGQKIAPFIVEINGIIQKTDLRDYEWVTDPTINISFPKEVPDFGLKPASWQEKYIVKPIKDAINNVLGIFTIFTPKAEITDYILSDDTDTSKIDTEINKSEDKIITQKDGDNKEDKNDSGEGPVVKNVPKDTEKKSIDNNQQQKIVSEEVKICSKESQTVSNRKIVINEVAWMGSQNSANDEWIELKNISGGNIDLNGWQILNADDGISIVFDDTIIPQNGFFLLERTDDDTVPFKKADFIYKGTLSNKNEKIYLFDADCQLQDMVSADPDWPAGDNQDRKTMERKSDLTWQTYYGYNNNGIWGTPREENSKPSVVVNNPVISSSGSSGGSGSSNINYCPQAGLISPSRDTVVINEVAWAGTGVSASDEWIELKNISNSAVNLNGWQLLDKDNQIKISFESGETISPNGFYLLERTDDDSVPNIVADKIYMGALSDSNESLRLFNDNCQLMDEVVAGPDWPAGESSTKRTMEREDNLGWHTYSNNEVNGVFGTPKQENGPAQTGQSSGDSNVITNEEVNYCSQTGLTSPSHDKVIINEVAWMGSQNSANDEWIELKNISGGNIDLNGWQLLDKDNDIKIIFKTEDLINANSLYLLERTDDDSVPNIAADKIYKGALSDTSESLRLFDSDCILEDEISSDPDWPAGESSNKKTMERSDDLSWHTYSLNDVDGVSGLYGTPKTNNSSTNINIPDNSSSSSHILISEIELGNEFGYEYIELYNQSDEPINLCPSDDNCYHLAYFSATNDWSDPNYNWKFNADTLINANDYYLINVYGDNAGDWVLNNSDNQPYKKEELNNYSGALAIFSNNPVYAGEEEKTDEELIGFAKSLKMDAVGWNSDGSETVVKEGLSFLISRGNKVLARKWHGSYIDTDNNLKDFNLEDPSPKGHSHQPPDGIDDLIVDVNSNQKNSVLLSWTIPTDEDPQPEDIIYEVYYSRNKEIDDNNLTKINQYVDINIQNSGENSKNVIIPDLYYDSVYYFAIKAKDLEGNYSPLSNKVEFRISPAIHQKESTLYDYARMNKSKYSGPINNADFTAFVKPNTGNIDISTFAASPAVDENGTVYIKAKIDGLDALYAYDKDGNKKWQHDCIMTDYEAPSLGKDGTIYFSAMYKLYALSPSGRVKWSYDFDRIYTDIVIDSQKRLLFIAEEGDGQELVLIEEIADLPVKTVLYHINGSVSSDNPILLLDVQDNIYFAFDSTVIKYKIGQGVIAEKSFSIRYCDTCSEQEGLTSRVGQLNISEDNIILFNLYQGGYDSKGRSYDIFYAIDNNLSNVLWTEDNYSELLGINGSQFYFYRGVPTPYYYASELCAADIHTGEILWAKRYGGQSPSWPVSPITVDTNGNIYFAQDSSIFGYNPFVISDDMDPEHDIIFFASGAGYHISSPVVIVDGVIYVPGIKALKRADT